MLGSTIGLGNLIATELIGLDEGLGVSDRFCCWVGKKGGGGVVPFLICYLKSCCINL